jgi:hypothetical protein
MWAHRKSSGMSNKRRCPYASVLAGLFSKPSKPTNAEGRGPL